MADLSGKELQLEHTYRVRSTLHRSRMCSVYAATWQPFDLTVYLRIFDQLGSLALPISVEERIEAHVTERAGKIRGPVIGDIVDVGRIQTDAFQVLRLPPGELLASWLERDGTLDPARTAELLTDVAAGLRACREKGLPHRAPTPDRIWFARDGDAFLMGPGEALYREDTLMMSAPVTAELVWHIAPEAFRFAPQTTEADGSSGPMRRFAADDAARLRKLEDAPAAEVYAMGCLAFRCLVGHHPFFTDPADPTLGISATLRDEPAQIEVLDELGDVADVIRRALSRDPGDRPATPEAFAAEFRVALEGRQPTIRSTAAFPTAGEDDDDEVFVAPPAASANPNGGGDSAALWRSSTLVLLAGVTLALVLGQLRRDTLLITSNPPGAMIQEVVGHIGVDRGRTPVLLRDRTFALPLRLQTVTNDGTASAPVELHPREFEDLGRCRTVELQLHFSDTPEGSGQQTP